MIIDVTTPHGLKGRTTSDASPTALATSSQTTRSVNQKYLYTESSGSSSSRGSDILVPPTSFTSFQNHSVGEFCDPPPAYETIVVPSTSNTARRFLKRSAHRSACATSQQSGESGESGESRGHTCSESWETIHISSSLRPVPENADSVTFKKLSRPFCRDPSTPNTRWNEEEQTDKIARITRHLEREILQAQKIGGNIM
ncbi:hypothetical protein OPQ81_007751 [Rhizoctonia solani]|nr:hypothetical protein OPQ81_007751 [Rhizoctonia solani]